MRDMLAGSMLKAAVHLLAGRSTAAETTKKIMEDFDKLMNSGDPTQATEILKPEARPFTSAVFCPCGLAVVWFGCGVCATLLRPPATSALFSTCLFSSSGTLPAGCSPAWKLA